MSAPTSMSGPNRRQIDTSPTRRRHVADISSQVKNGAGGRWGGLIIIFRVLEMGSLSTLTNNEISLLAGYYRFQFNCSFLPKSEIFYTPDVKNLGLR